MLYLGLGTNIGNRLKNIELAYNLINKHIGIIKQKSSIWESNPWGFVSTNKFYNSACSIEPYSKHVGEIMNQILYIEKKMGRVRTKFNSYEDRIIDIDILAFDNNIICNDNISIPHPKLHQRLFALIPLKEIAPEWNHPLLKLNIDDLIKQCIDKSELLFVKH